MRRDTLANLPGIDLPGGDILRGANANDAEGLAETLGAAFPDFGWTDDKVRAELLDHPEVFQTYVVQRAGAPVATASCKRIADDASTGYLHWCGVHPSAQGARLGRMVCIAVLEAFGKDGMTSAILDTDDFRIPAIKTYLRLDFSPVIRDDDDQVRWSALAPSLHPGDAPSGL